MILDSRRAADCGRSGSALVLGSGLRSQTGPRLGPSLGPLLAVPGCLTSIGFQLMLRLAALELVVGRRTAWRRVHMQQGVKKVKEESMWSRTRCREEQRPGPLPVPMPRRSTLRKDFGGHGKRRTYRWRETTRRQHCTEHHARMGGPDECGRQRPRISAPVYIPLPCADTPRANDPSTGSQQGAGSARTHTTHIHTCHMLSRGMHRTQAC
ncbi:hypothetical protein EDB81DRAFT_511121 [Dactylonectria macrodidyma]|uniref:Uncharacterized protein n=1 Tax=Dactylonectria macrodidyma TaxID=307937 RepID=A0A9P9EPE2_9HYPO|nr:hypothetical protein EDB81DRAFT_511121 [Dactylonectria macrodidyma]